MSEYKSFGNDSCQIGEEQFLNVVSFPLKGIVLFRRGGSRLSIKNAITKRTFEGIRGKKHKIQNNLQEFVRYPLPPCNRHLPTDNSW